MQPDQKRKFKDSDFRIEQMKEEYFDELMTLIKESFATRGPVICGLHLGKEEVLEFFSHSAKEWIKYQPSVCAIYIPENKIVGANLTKILTRNVQETFKDANISHYTPGVQTLIKILSNIESSCNIFKQDETADKVLEIAVLAVDLEFSGNKLSYRMNEESERIALELGCQIATTQATNKISQHIFRKIGYENRFWIDYRDVEVDGIKPLDISAMHGSTGAIAFIKYLK
ncbi:hypothetical protein Avbf_09356 [Armadillidium vulgare]|nr:hypothetical protein Avbf_09356 [Armadillidium vulgare]